MRTFVPDRTCWSLLLTTLAIILRNKPTYNKLRVLIINKDVRKSLARKNGNENPIWSWNDSVGFLVARPRSSDILTSAFLVPSPYSSDGTTDSVLCRMEIISVAD